MNRDLSFEKYGDGYIIADYSSHQARFCGKSFAWRAQPLINDPFPTEEHAEAAARSYFELELNKALRDE